MQNTTELKSRLGVLAGQIASIQASVQALEFIHINGVIEASRAGEVGKGFLVIFDEMLRSVNKSKEDLREFRRSIAIIIDETKIILESEKNITGLLDGATQLLGADGDGLVPQAQKDPSRF